MIKCKNDIWQDKLYAVFNSKKYIDFCEWLINEYKNKTIYPSIDNIFNAIDMVGFDDVKVVIIGQDPYHEPNQAHGLSFSVEGDVVLPPSLKNIFKELHDDIGIVRTNGNLTGWAKQGVLLLNTVLTVEKGKANSHKGLMWESVTAKIISSLNDRETPIVFLLWGNQAKSYQKMITNKIHYVIKSAHPSPMSANRGGWFGSRPFSRTNAILRSVNQKEINWSL